MFEGLDSEDKDPRKSLHVSEVAVPELAPDEAYVAVMASSINFNTVWTSIFEPLPTFGFLDRLGQGEPVGQAARPRLPRGRIGRRRRGPADRVGGPPVEAGGQGHRPLQLRRRPEPERPRRLDPGRQPAHLGVRDQLRRPGRPGRGQGQPADAQGRPPDVGGGRGQRPVQLHVVPDAGVEERRPHGPGRQGAGVGGVGRARRLRRPVRAQRGRDAGGRGVVAGQGRAPPRPRGGGGHRPQGGQLPVLEGRAHPGRVRVASAGQGHPRPGRRGRGHRVRASRDARPWGRRCSRPSGAA